MQKFLAIPDFAKAGLNSDLMPWDLPGSFLTEIRNVRIDQNKISPLGGTTLWVDLPDDFVAGYVQQVSALSGSFWVICGLNAVYVYDGDTLSEITSTAGYGGITNENLWQGCTVSRIPVFNNPNHYPEYWSPQNAATLLQPLMWDDTQTWQQKGESAQVIRSHKQYMFALNLQSTTYGAVPDGVRWSSPADVGGLPESWDELDQTNVAGFTTLGAEGGSVIDGRSMRDSFVVYRESGISVFELVGGQFVWRIRNLSNDVGLVAADALVEVKTKHYFIGDGDIYVNDGNQVVSLLHNRIRTRFTNDYDSDNYANSYAVKNTYKNEIWFCIPRTGDEFPSVAYIYNWKDDSWAIRDIPPNPTANYGALSVPPITWANVEGNWDNYPGTWTEREGNPFSDTIVMATKPKDFDPDFPDQPAIPNGSLLMPDRVVGGLTTEYYSVVERTGFALEGLNNVTTITRIYPHMRGPTEVFIQIGSQDYPGAPVRWKEAVSYFPERDRKVDIRTTGELHCFRVFSPKTTTIWELSGMDIEYVSAGAR